MTRWGCPYYVPWNQCLVPAQKLCCVYTLRTRYVTVYIVTLFALSDAGLKHELSSDYRVVDCARWNTETRCPLFFPEYKVFTGTVPEFLLVYLKKGVFTLVSSEYRTRAPCPGTKCERCLSLLRRGLSVLWGGWGERKRERKGHDGKGKERRETSGSRLFPLPVVPRALSIFCSIIAIFIRIPSGSFCGGERPLPLFLNYIGWHRKTNDINSVWLPTNNKHCFKQIPKNAEQ